MGSVSRRDFIKKSVAAGSALAAGSLARGLESKEPSRKHPNLLFVFPDQMRGQALGFLGEEPVITPTLDRFAAEGVVFTQAVSNFPLCSPFRAMFMTGKYPLSNGVLNNCNVNSSKYGPGLGQSERCWSDVLRERGYSLGYIGKWHLDNPRKPYVKWNPSWNEWCPPQRRHGFDFWYAYGTYDHHMHPRYWATNSPRDKEIRIDQWGPIHEADMAIRYIRNEGGRYRDRDKPFALVVANNPPHMPYRAYPKEYRGRWYKNVTDEQLFSRPDIPPKGSKWGDYYRKNIRDYFTMITGVDEQFGRILEALRDEGLERDTIVVFTSDHGNCLGIHNEISKNNPYEESMRVPLIIRWPGKIKPRRDDLLISSPDLYPTLLDLMGFAADIPRQVEGTSFASYIITGEGDRPASQLYLKPSYAAPAGGLRGVRTLRYKLVVRKSRDNSLTYRLYDRSDDPYEMKNIAGRNPKIVRTLMEEELIPWLKKTRDPWLKGVSTA